MQPLKSLGPKFPNSDRGLEMGPVTSVKEGRDLVARAPFGNARDLEGRPRFANRGGLSTACNISNNFPTFRSSDMPSPKTTSISHGEGETSFETRAIWGGCTTTGTGEVADVALKVLLNEP